MTSVAGSTFASFNPAQIASQLMSKGDQNGDAAMSFLEFMKLSENSSTETSSASASSTSSSSSSSSSSSQRMESLFDAIDTNSDNSVTEEELTEFGQNISDAMTAAMLQMQEQCANCGASSQSSSNDSLDTNKDGIVSLMERLAARQGNQNGNQSLENQIRSLMALNSYQNSHATNTSSFASALSVSA